MAKIPKGLYRRRRRDGTPSATWWCYYYVPGRRQPIQENTGTSDVEEATRFLFGRRAEHPTARTERIASETITIADALTLLVADRQRRDKWVQNALVSGLRHALGHLKIADLRRKHLDDVCHRWRSVGIEYPERKAKTSPMRPASGTTCNHGTRTLRAALKLAVEKLGAVVPISLTYPRYDEHVTGLYIPPSDFFRILQHINVWPKAALVELAYLTGVRKGQLRATALRNVRVEHGTVKALVWEGEKVKNRRPHEIPLEGRAQEIVQRLWDERRLGCALFHVDGRPIGDLRSEWRRACKEAGLPCGRKLGGFVLHDTRRSAITNLAEVGVPDTVARSISGHRTASVHARYQITQESAKRAALAKMSDAVVQFSRR